MTVFAGHTQSDYSFDYQEKELSEVSDAFVKKHFLGENVAQQMQLLRESYTYKVEDEISKVVNTVIEKPSIYNSVNKMNKYLKKKVKSKEITLEEAEKTLSKVLMITLNIRHQDTADLEEELWELKDPTQLNDLYTNRIALSSY
ncbi:MAG: hypothetical protein AAGA66_20255 [Bacteroidota bacterium]